MAVIATCPGCQTVYNLADNLCGKKVRCRKCQEMFVAGAAPGRRPETSVQTVRATPVRPRTMPPAPVDEDPTEVNSPEEETRIDEPGPSARRRDAEGAVPRRRRERDRAEPKSRLPLILGLSIGGVVLAAGIGIGVWLLTSNGSKEGGAPGPGGAGGPAVVPPGTPAAQVNLVKAASRTVPLESQAIRTEGLLFAAPQAHQAVVLQGPTNESFDRYDLNAGRKLGSTRIPGLTTPYYMALSPDGSTLAVLKNPAQNEVTVWSLAQGKELAARLKVEGTALKREIVGPGGVRSRVIVKNMAWMAFLDPDRLLVVHWGGERTVWKVPEGKEVYSVAPGPNPKSLHLQIDPFSKRPRNLAVTRDRKLLVIQAGDAFELIDTANGKRLRTLEGAPVAGGSLGNVWAMAFNPDGSQLAALFDQYPTQGALKGERILKRWDTKTGRVVAAWVVPQPPGFAGALSWWGPEHVLVWNGLLTEALVTDLRTGKYVRHLVLPMGGRGGPGAGDGRLWYVTGKDHLGPGFLTAVDFPEAEIQQPAPQQSRYTDGGVWYLTPDGIEKAAPGANGRL